MIDIKQLEKKGNESTPYLQEYKLSLIHRGMSESLLDQLFDLNQVRKNLITQAETAKSSQNKISGEIAVLKKNKRDASALLSQMQELSRQVKEMEVKAQEAEQKVFEFASLLPNKCHHSVPVGASAADNKVIHVVGEQTKFAFKAKEHWQLGESLGIIDFERASKVAGARFAFLKGLGARLERALMQMMMDLHSQHHGYTEVIPPFLANSKSFFGVGQFPKFKQDVFHVSDTDYFMIPTAEVPVTNLFRDEILKEEDLPVKFVAFSPCFRSEAGSHGRDTKGLIRQHQFHKVELMTFVHPDQSYEEHEKLTSHAEEVLKQLELPFRRSLLCTGDISFGAAKCFDLEVWLPGPGEYREISSCSNFEDFQARRAQIRFRPRGEGKPQFVHTLNGSGLAIGRTLIAILENYQQEDGSVRIPKVLQPYMGGMKEISASHDL